MSSTFQIGTHAADFIWASGVEDTFVPQTRPGERPLDEYDLVGHYDHWREDLALAHDLGVKALRWGIPWYRVEPRQGVFDWQWTDQVLPYLAEELNITPIVDLMHYGCPFWLEREFDNPGYPAAVAAYAAAFAERYRHLVRWYTPLNEPVCNAWRCGQRGVWPPYLRGDRGYVRMMLQLARGIVQTVTAIRAVDPDTIMVHVDVAEATVPAHAEHTAAAAHRVLRGLLCYDLISGRVTPEHALAAWLAANGAASDELAGLQRSALALDVVGLNFYPQWGTKQVDHDRRGRHIYRPVERDGRGFAQLVETYWERYGVPLMITETSARGSDELRADWLSTSLAAVKALRGSGVPVIGYTWFPMFTMLDWSYRAGTRPWEAYRVELGMYQLDGKVGRPRWRTTPLVEQYRAAIRDAETSIGPLRNRAGLVPPSLTAASQFNPIGRS